jgi:hypothetical protein
MSIDLSAAERFLLANCRLLDRHRAAILLHGAPTDRVLEALRPYRNPDGGFGHALEPDVRANESETSSTLHAFDVLAEIDALDDPMVDDAVAWLDSVAEPDGGVPIVMPTAAAAPHAPWMQPSPGSSPFTFALAAHLCAAGRTWSWLQRAVDWCWTTLDGAEQMGGYDVKLALAFLDGVPDDERAKATIELLRPAIGPDGSLPVAGGTENERLTAVTLSPRPGARSRALFTDAQIDADLDRLEASQRDDGGWEFDWLAWSPGQASEWRGIVTLRGLLALADNGRLQVPAAGQPSA